MFNGEHKNNNENLCNIIPQITHMRVHRNIIYAYIYISNFTLALPQTTRQFSLYLFSRENRGGAQRF